ncbi:hypothetical protein BH160DRAFT_4837 [Burkholderia sp. H160]|nr:hypothetical protein BH160DRAFT_4837 [Burkholderia sp. H160]
MRPRSGFAGALLWKLSGEEIGRLEELYVQHAVTGFK